MSYFEKNIEALAAREIPWRDGLLNALRRAKPLAVTETSRPGMPTVYLRSSSGAEIALHSARDPIREAEKWISTNISADHTHALIAGFGLGYSCEAAFKLFPNIEITVVEPNVEVLATALHCRDLAGLISNPRLTILAGPFRALSKPLEAVVEKATGAGGENAVLVHGPSLKALPESDKDFAEIFGFMGNVKKSSSGVHEELSRRNENMNAKAGAESPNLAGLAGEYSGKTAVFVAPGPSLRKNMQHLKLFKGRAVIVAADAALAPMLNAGIAPDFTVTTDPTAAVAAFFPLSCHEYTNLVFIRSSNPDVVAMFPNGKRVFCPVTKDMSSKDAGTLFVAGSVSLSCVDFCVKLGCSRVIFAGLDFAISEAGTHVSGSAAKPTFVIKKAHQMCDGYLGYQVSTTESLMIYLRAMEEYIAAHSNSVEFVDATEGGALINGAAIMPMPDAAFGISGDAPRELPVANNIQYSAVHLSCPPGMDAPRMPASVAVLPGGNIAVSDARGGAVYLFGSPGAEVKRISGFKRPMGICAAPDGGFFVADAWAHSVHRFDQNGELSGSFGSPGLNPGELREPWGVCMFNGLVVVSERESGGLALFTPEGDFIGRKKAFFMYDGYAPPLTALTVSGEYLLALQTSGSVLVLDDDFNCEDVLNVSGGGIVPWWLYPAGEGAFCVASMEGELRALGFGRAGAAAVNKNIVQTQIDQPVRVAALCNFIDGSYSFVNISDATQPDVAASLRADSNTSFFVSKIKDIVNSAATGDEQAVADVIQLSRAYSPVTGIMKHIDATALGEVIARELPHARVTITEMLQIAPMSTNVRFPMTAVMLDEDEFMVVFHPNGGSVRVTRGECVKISDTEPDSVIHAAPDGAGGFMGVSFGREAFRFSAGGAVLKRYSRIMASSLMPGRWGACPKQIWDGKFAFPVFIPAILDIFDIDGVRDKPVKLPGGAQPIDTAMIHGGEHLAVLALDGFIYIMDRKFGVVDKHAAPTLGAYVPSYIDAGPYDSLFVTYYEDNHVTGYPSIITNISTLDWGLKYAVSWYSEPEGVRRFTYSTNPIPCDDGSFWVLDRNNWRLLKFAPHAST